MPSPFQGEKPIPVSPYSSRKRGRLIRFPPLAGGITGGGHRLSPRELHSPAACGGLRGVERERHARVPCLLAINRQSQRERTLKRPLTFSRRLQPASSVRPAIDGWADYFSLFMSTSKSSRGFLVTFFLDRVRKILQQRKLRKSSVVFETSEVCSLSTNFL
jgi:hypothetical protein